MITKITVNNNDIPIYDIVLSQDYSGLVEELQKLGTHNRKLCIVSDSIVSKLYLDNLKSILTNYSKEVETYVFPAGEESKNLDTVYSLYELLIQAKFDRKDMLIALGGGVVGDLTGYVAATYLRGIQFVQMPTSLLAMVDSSIGGKTGVDFQAYKNMIGAFHQPSLVYMNLSTLFSLKNKEFNSGFGEIIKHGLIKDADYYKWLKENQSKINERDINSLQEMVYRSCIIKRDVVEKDPKELGDRALLNFGHTLGHAIEKLMDFKLLHGECVAVGMVAASFISYERGFINKDQLDDIVAVIKGFELPISISGLNPEEIIAITANDKKVESGNLKFILLSNIGKSIIDTMVTGEEMSKAIQYILRVE